MLPRKHNIYINHEYINESRFSRVENHGRESRSQFWHKCNRGDHAKDHGATAILYQDNNTHEEVLALLRYDNVAAPSVEDEGVEVILDSGADGDDSDDESELVPARGSIDFDSDSSSDEDEDDHTSNISDGDGGDGDDDASEGTDAMTL